MKACAPLTALAGVLFALASQAWAGEKDEKEPSIILEMGGSGEWGLQRGSMPGFGPEIGFEYDMHWLEIEAATSPKVSHGQAEIGTDFLLKKPFEISERWEFLIGGGPEWVHKTSESPKDSLAAEAALEFVYAPFDNENIRVYAEPTYSYDFGKGHEQSLGFTAGLLIKLR
jgi:hypothetical protein